MTFYFDSDCMSFLFGHFTRISTSRCNFTVLLRIQLISCLCCVVRSPYHSSYSRIVVNAALSFGHSFIPIVSRILTRSFFHLTTQFGVKKLRPSLSIECPKKLPMKSHLYLQWICINRQYQDVAVYQVKCITHRHKK